jgi:hypothetical protein
MLDLLFYSHFWQLVVTAGGIGMAVSSDRAAGGMLIMMSGGRPQT